MTCILDGPLAAAEGISHASTSLHFGDFVIELHFANANCLSPRGVKEGRLPIGMDLSTSSGRYITPGHDLRQQARL